jgi:hypothetical protein
MQVWATLLSLIFVLAVNAPAVTYTFIATGPVAPGLSPLNENPPHPESSATGSALITWDTSTNTMTMTVNVVFSGLTTPNTMAHIHCCVAPPGNTGVATTVPTFIGFPTGQTSGTYAHTYDMNSAASYNPAFITANGGTVASAAAVLLKGMLAGQAYLNIHTQRFPPGEERGFLVAPVNVSIKPGSTPPVKLNPRSHGKIPVAILSTATFNALTNVDATSLLFGGTGKENSLAFCNPGGEDVNGDGLLDLVCHFNTESVGIKSGDTTLILTGKTFQGTPIIGQEAIVTVP